MKFNNLYIHLLGLLIILIACTDENNGSGEKGIPLKIESLMFSGVSLRSTLSSGNIGVYRLAGTGYSETKNNVHYTNTGSGWTVATGVTPIYLTKNSANLCAYYPYSSNAEYANGGTAVTLTSQEYATSKDLCYKTNVTASSTQSATFTLSHAYAMLTFTLTRGSTYPKNATCAVSNISIANAGIISAGTLNMTAGSYATTTLGSVTYDAGITGIASGSSVTTSVLMIPVTTAMSSNIMLTVTVDGKPMSTTLSISTLAANTNYSIPITINGTALSVGSVTFTTGWTIQTVTSTANSTSGSMVESNCYMVQPGGTVYIPVSRVTAGQKVATANSSYTLPTDWTTGLLWTNNSNGLNSSGAIAGIVGHVGAGYITVTAGSAEGNSVVYIKNASGEILWSWHIWTTDQPATEMVNGYVWMDRNLGATAVATNTADVTFATCGGLFYQWGRKDPFPGSDGYTTGTATSMSIFNTSGQINSITYPSEFTTQPTATGTTNDVVKYFDAGTSPISYTYQCAYSIKYPLLFLANWAGCTADSAANYTTRGGMSSWGGEFGESKSIFDPCPAGWRVPSGRKTSSTFVSPWSTWTTAQIFTASAYVALLWNATLNTYYYPAAGQRDAGSGALIYVGRNGRYWSGSASSMLPPNDYGILLNLYSNVVNPTVNGNRAIGFSVRCVQE
jgi:hypothetical protein